jgi:hypothetical protein
MKIDITKPVRTRDGRPVTLISDQGRDGLPIVGYIADERHVSQWYANGHVLPDQENESDLIQDLEMWVNVYPGGGYGMYHDYHQACKANHNPIARVRVPYTMGQFDTPQA